VSNEEAVKALEKFVGWSDWSMWSMESTKVLDAAWATQTQGQKSCIKRYKNCPVMHESVPAECKPMIFENGVLIPFKQSGKEVKRPRFSRKYLLESTSSDDVPTDVPDDSIDLDKASSVDSCEVEQGCHMKEVTSEEVDSSELSVHSNSPVWMPDESACSCTKCNERFTMFRRRHHCRACGAVCCAQCAPRTSHAWPVLFKQSPQPTFKRLCKDCLSSPEHTPPGGYSVVEKNTFIDVKEITFIDCSASRACTA